MPVDGYPTTEELEKLASFYGTPKDFVDYVESIYQNGSVEVDPTPGILHRGYEVSTVTMGWSGCEEINSVIHRGLEGDSVGIFYMRYWESLHRGGLTTYLVPDQQWEVEQYLGDVKNWRDGNDAG